MKISIKKYIDPTSLRLQKQFTHQLWFVVVVVSVAFILIAVLALLNTL